MNLRLNLPKPISQNRLFRNKRYGRVCTEEYNTWKLHALAMIQDQKPFEIIAPPVRVRCLVGEKGIRKDADIDNMSKCLIDALVQRDILPDDKREFLRAVSVEWVQDMEGAQVVIEPAYAAKMPALAAIGTINGNDKPRVVK